MLPVENTRPPGTRRRVASIVQTTFPQDGEVRPEEDVNLNERDEQKRFKYQFRQTHNGSYNQRKEPERVVRVGLEDVRRDLMHLPATDRTDGEDVEARREYEREDERRTGTRAAEHQREDGEDDGEERRGHCGELRALAERRGYEERPAGKRETEQEVDDDDDADVRRGEDAEVPYDGDDDPCREVR